MTTKEVITFTGHDVAIFKDTLNQGEEIDLSDLPRIHLPAGGGLTWELPSGKATKEIAAIILHRKMIRAYWREKYTGSHEPPDCSSIDYLHGIGDPGGDCLKCPLSQWSSANEGRGKACHQLTRLFLLLPGSYLPVLLVLPPTSYKEGKRYAFHTQGAGKAYYEVVTGISLIPATNESGLTYSQASFRIIEATVSIPDVVAQYRTSLLPFLETEIETEEIKGE